MHLQPILRDHELVAVGLDQLARRVFALVRPDGQEHPVRRVEPVCRAVVLQHFRRVVRRVGGDRDELDPILHRGLVHHLLDLGDLLGV
jgi:hypothetical protein